jgi:hypothetical protein
MIESVSDNFHAEQSAANELGKAGTEGFKVLEFNNGDRHFKLEKGMVCFNSVLN